mmetsp:Transcript_19950/g.29704  ORF Transcript_19950/g.29704 Transcript_19950/m.29704 type:complete len:188 (-) Transcript_19950:312-875(-)|eukprot:CAMPEP_0116012360 /NCGR_PEP_ID=MMETSP0321-20121206/5081_1 /TAXON_ID=163516 /ORGANISM="Leptocylindrus danicus var. danicus, Strain B650" /LENGTH=187 /DNA_ID=CAMNT_0003481697 /DNA_START=150 /DNA_END=713 /DNA_ORIENTATION=+
MKSNTSTTFWLIVASIIGAAITSTTNAARINSKLARKHEHEGCPSISDQNTIFTPDGTAVVLKLSAKVCPVNGFDVASLLEFLQFLLGSPGEDDDYGPGSPSLLPSRAVAIAGADKMEFMEAMIRYWLEYAILTMQSMDKAEVLAGGDPTVPFYSAAMHFDESSPYKIMAPMDSPMDLAVDFCLSDE